MQEWPTCLYSASFLGQSGNLEAHRRGGEGRGGENYQCKLQFEAAFNFETWSQVFQVNQSQKDSEQFV